MYKGKLKFVEENEGIFLKANLANSVMFLTLWNWNNSLVAVKHLLQIKNK